MLMLIKVVHDFSIIIKYFNTSHVNVNQIERGFHMKLKNFNTSHVNVNLSSLRNPNN